MRMKIHGVNIRKEMIEKENKKYKINEIFYSVQGEGFHMGMPAIFIRFAGCNLNCGYCDTKNDANYEYDLSSLLEIVNDISRQYNTNNIILTGGEPTLQIDAPIINNLYLKYKIYLETNGSKEVEDIEKVDYIVCSPKKDVKINIQRIDELKLVLAQGDKIDNYINLIGHKIHREIKNFYISPVHVISNNIFKENIDYCFDLLKDNSRYKLTYQIHKILGLA